MSSTIRLTFLLLLSVIVVGSLFAQDQQDPRKWSTVDLRMTKLATSGEAAAIPQAKPNFENPNKSYRVLNTPQGTYVAAPNIRVHPSTTFWQSEVPITRHPTNANIMYGSSNAVKFGPLFISEGMYLTSDGGTTWFGSDTTTSAPINGHSGDPAPAIGPDGRLYMSMLLSSGVGATYSTNMGQTWANNITIASGSQDKNHTFVDAVPGSPYFGRAYVTWSLFTAAAPPAVVSVSSNGGANWTAPLTITPVAASHYAQGVNGAVGPNGVAYIAWQNPVAASPFTGDFIGFGKSTDGGTTWTANNNVYDCNGARNSSLTPWSIRINDFPSMAIDMTNGGRRGWIYIVTCELNLAPAGSDQDIVLHRSSDGGTTWSPGVRVNQDPLNNTKKQYMPWMTVDEAGGVNVVYYDNRNSAAGDSVEVMVSRSLDGGSTFTDIVVSDHKFRPAPIPGLAGGYQGDYIGITSGNGKLWPYWADNSSGIYQAWTTSITTTEGFGWVKGTITSLGTATAVSGATVDFVDPIPQVSGSSNAAGLYYAGARVDTPATTRNVVMRARKFGFIDTTFAITITRNDTLTRNFQMRPAPGGTLSVYSHTATNNLRSYVEVKFGAQVVVSDSTNATTGLLVVPLPVGTYSVRVDAPSPYATKTFPTVVITDGATTNVDALTASVLTFNPTAVRDTLPVDGSRTKTFTMTNTTPDTVRFRITDDNALARIQRFIDPSLPSVKRSMEQQRSATVGKGQRDPTPGQPASPNGRGGPDAFGYSWIDSDEPGGPVFNWFDISTIGTQITTLTSGTLDDGYLTLPIPFSFPLYGTTYSTMNIGTNGFANFGTGSASLSNGAIPSIAAPNNALYAFWDDLDFRTSGKLLYYNDVANSRFVVQYDKAPRFGATTDTLSFQMILKPNGEILYQFLRVVGSVLISGTIGVENSTGTVALQVVNNATYVHNNLAIRVFLPDAPWISENPTVGAIPPLGNQIVQCTFDATGLTAGTTYNANLSVDATHPDVSSPFVVPASLRVNVADSALLVLNKTSITFPGTVIGNTRRDTINARNAGALTLNVSSITTTNSRYTLSAPSAVIAPGANTDIIVTYTPIVPAGTDTGRVIFLSNSQGTPRKDVTLTGTAIGAPIFSTVVDSLTKVVPARGLDSTQFFVRNTGTLVGNYAARAVMYPRTAAGDKPGEPIIIPMTIRPTQQNHKETTFGESSAPNPDEYDASRRFVNAEKGGQVIMSSLAVPAASSPEASALFSALVPELMYYKFNESGGAATPNFASAPVGTNPAPLVGLTMGGAGQFGSALVGTNTASNYVETGWTTALGSGSWTISMWLNNLPSSTTLNYLFGDVTATSFRCFLGGAAGAGAVTLRATGLTDMIVTGVAPGPTVVTYVYDGPTQTLTSYKNGVLVGTRPATAININGTGTTPFRVGAYSTLAGLPAAGLMDEFRMYNRALPASEIAATWNVELGGGSNANWLSIAPTAGTIAIGDSTQFTANFDARDASIFTNPGSYFGRIEINATNSALADTLKIPVRMTVTPVSGPAIIANPTALTFPATAIGENRRDSSRVRNVGSATLSLTSVTTTNPKFVATATSTSIAAGDSARIRVVYTPTVPAGTDTGRVIILSNDPATPRVDITLTGTAIGAPIFSTVVDSLTKVVAARGLDSTQFFVRNTGTLVGNYAARAVMYPRTAAGDKPGEPIIIPMNVSVSRTPSVVNSNAAERSPFSSPLPFPSTQAPDAQFDLQFDRDAVAVTGAAGNAAAVFINNEFWTSRWATNILHRWTVGGTLIEQFTIAGVTGVRGLATDGTFLYASTNTAAIYKIDPVTKTLVSTITCPSPVTTRTIAYDPVRDGFWVSNFADALTCVSRTGTVIATMPNTLAAKYGSAYDNVTPGGPFLWVFDQTNGTGGTPQNVTQFNLNTLTSTGVSFDVLTRVTTGGTLPIAGGLFIATGIVPGKVTIGGLLQGGGTGPVDRLFGLELGDAGVVAGPWLSVAPTAGTIAIGDSTQFTAKFDARDASIFTNPGSYFGRIEINATNSALADTLKIPVRMTVTPISGPALLATPDSVGYGNLAIGATDSSKSFLVKNFGNATLNVTNIVSNNTAFTPSRTSFSLVPNDTARVRVRFTAPTPAGVHNGTFTLSSNDPLSPAIVKVRGASVGAITVTVPNGGESWAIGSTQQIVWTRDPAQVDTVKIELSRAGSGGPWEVLTAGVPARPNTWIHPKGLMRPIEGSYFVSDAGTFNWTVTGPASTNCYVRVSKKSNATIFDISNAAFGIAAASTGDTSWVIQPSGTTSTLYSVKAISNNVVWVAGTGGVVLRTTNGGTNWTSVGGGAIGVADIYAIEALDANTAFVTTTPGTTFIYKTTNGGTTWTQVYTLTGGFIDGIQMRTATEGYAVGDPVPTPSGIWTVLKTTDGGATWARMATQPVQVGAEAGWNNSFQLLGNTLWFGTNSSKAYRSTDLGVTWTSAATPAVNGYGIAFNNATQGVLVSATGVTNRSTDGGTTWAAGGAAGTGQGSGASGVSGAEFWATVGTNVYYTTNGGTGWSAAAKNGYTGAAALWALDMVSPTAGSTYGWAGGATGTIVRYRRIATDVANSATEIPTVYALDQNFPNPFNPSTTIKFALPEQSIVSLKIYNLLGQEIATLAEGDMPAASHTVVWSGRNNAGSQVATGMYFCRFEATGASGTKFNSLKKLILLK